MKKVTTLVLMLCLVFSGAFYNAYGATETGNEIEKSKPKIAIIKSQQGGTDKSGSILPSIYDNVLSVVFTEYLGQVTVEVSTTTGMSVEFTSVLTPNGLLVYIPNAGNYIVTFTLENGDEYYGEFTVTD